MNNNLEFLEKLRVAGLRPTKQRLKICEILYNRKKTFHFTISELSKNIKKETGIKIALATVYNTVNAFKEKGYLKEIYINSQESYFDTNVTGHHHFYDEDKNELIDLDHSNVGIIDIKKKLPNKIIKSVEVLVKVSEKK